MTELAEAPTVGRDGTITRIPHWIDGARVDGHVGPQRARSSTRRPACQTGAGRRSPRPRRSTPRSQRADRRVPGLAHDVAREAGRALLRVPRARPRRTARTSPQLITAEHGKVLSRRDGRGGARPRGRRVRLRHPDAAQGRLLRAGLDRRRRLLDPPAARRRRRHHAVQLPGDGADVDVRPRSRAATRSCSSRREKDPSASLLTRRAAQGGRPARRRLQRRPRRQGGGRRAPRAPRRSRAVSLRRLDADRALHLRDGTKHGKRVQALGGAKNHMVVLPDADIDMAADAAVSAGYGSAGERCMAISVARRGRRRRRPARRRRSRSGCPKLKVGDRDASPTPRWARSSRASTATRSPSYIERGRRAGRDGRRRRARVRARRRRLLPRRLAARQRHAGDGRLQRRDLRAGALRRARRRPTTRRSRSSTTTRTATASRSSPATAARRGSSSSTSRSGMVGINVPIPVPVAYYSFGGWKASLFGDTHVYGPEGDPLLHAREGRHVAAGPIRPPAPSTSASRRPAESETAPVLPFCHE